jgi:uncharacterized membrane protein
MRPGRLIEHGMLRTVAAMPIVIAIKFVLIDTLLFRAMHAPAGATVVMNVQIMTGAIVVAALILVRLLTSESSATRRFAGAMAVLLALVAGTVEIDRAFDRSAALMAMFANPHLAKQVAFSIFFSAFALASIAGGFAGRAAPLRYFGLTLFALTLLKVAAIDLGAVAAGYRFLSFIGLGLLLLGTSVLYGKVSPKLLAGAQ